MSSKPTLPPPTPRPRFVRPAAPPQPPANTSWVRQGHRYVVAGLDTSVGTTGLGPCVGVIALVAGGVWCAHIEDARAGAPVLEDTQRLIATLMNSTLGPTAAPTEIHCATGGAIGGATSRDSSAQIIRALTIMYPNITVTANSANAIWWDGTEGIRCVRTGSGPVGGVEHVEGSPGMTVESPPAEAGE